MTVHFTMKAGKLSATMTNGRLTVNQNGDITAVSVLPGVKSVAIDKVEHNVAYLHHGTKDSMVRFSFRLEDKTHAQLEILNPTPLGISPPKPIRLDKQTKKH